MGTVRGEWATLGYINRPIDLRQGRSLSPYRPPVA